MITPFDDREPDELRRIGSHMVGRLELGIDQANAQMVSVSGWLTAALFALNGGGALAALNSAATLDAPLYSAAAFGTGLIFAMLNAVLIQQLILLAAAPSEALLMFWRTVEATGTIEREVYENLAQPINAQQRWYWVAPSLGWLSGVAFIVGATTLAIDSANRSPSVVRVCGQLQRDMLDPKQEGDRSRELFTTVGCRFAD